MWDFQGFLTSTEFLAQIAAAISAIFVAFAENFINLLFAVG